MCAGARSRAIANPLLDFKTTGRGETTQFSHPARTGMQAASSESKMLGWFRLPGDSPAERSLVRACAGAV
jgi:hypothetical protein